jgi:transposase
MDESLYGGTKTWKRGRGAAGKVAIFGMLKRQEKACTVIVHDRISCSLMPEVLKKIAPHSIVYTDSYHSCNVLGVSGFQHRRFNHPEEFANKKTK